jgi:hypothetical protein
MTCKNVQVYSSAYYSLLRRGWLHLRTDRQTQNAIMVRGN